MNGFVALVVSLFVVTAVPQFALSQSVPASSTHSSVTAQNAEFRSWLVDQKEIATTRLLMNISAPGTARGSVIASPSRHDPNYFFYWVRDGSLTMNAVNDLYIEATGQKKDAYFSRMDDFKTFSRGNQLTHTWPGLGDPRFNADGSPDNLPWGRPQNDGPALRALTFTRFANELMALGKVDYVKSELYSGRLPADTVIKADLEYIAHHWNEKSIDLWEEVYGHHFFTRAATYVALLEGSMLAAKLGDGAAASFYHQKAMDVENALASHWSDDKGYYIQTLEMAHNPDHEKPSQLDSATILAVLAANHDEGILSPMSDKILATATALEQMFARIYPINSDKSVGTAIGRYAEDYYYGGNPWFLHTAAFAELHYKVAGQLKKRTSYYVTELSAEFFASSLPESDRARVRPGTDILADQNLKRMLISSMINKGDGFMQRIRKHIGPKGNMSEQYDRNTGFMLSANDLTWSYSTFIEAVMERDHVTADESSAPFLIAN